MQVIILGENGSDEPEFVPQRAQDCSSAESKGFQEDVALGKSRVVWI